jgi:hypothetical protein
MNLAENNFEYGSFIFQDTFESNPISEFHFIYGLK